MLPRGERRRRAREEATRFQDQLTAFGELLAGHPFATGRPGTTHMMAVEYARALDAYDKATREAARNPATQLFLSPLLVLAGRPLFLGGLALTLAAVSGALIGALTGHQW
ncbi:hypothetical protein ACWCQS_18300 [Streptomyces sp. NPDC002076]